MKKRHLSKKEVEHTAWLAHIKLSEKEKTLFTEQFNDILDYFKKIDKVDTEDVVELFGEEGFLFLRKLYVGKPSCVFNFFL